MEVSLWGRASIRHVGRNPRVPPGVPSGPKAAFIAAKSGEQLVQGCSSGKHKSLMLWKQDQHVWLYSRWEGKITCRRGYSPQTLPR